MESRIDTIFRSLDNNWGVTLATLLDDVVHTCNSTESPAPAVYLLKRAVQNDVPPQVSTIDNMLLPR
jgi:hypothetical protein